MRLQALIFDVDGTLADTEEAHRCAFNDAFVEFGLDWNWSKPTYAHLLMTAGGKERIVAHIDSLRLTAAERQRLLSRTVDLHRIKTRHYTRRVLAGSVPLRDGVARLLNDARHAGVSLCIASTTSLANIDALLRTHLGDEGLERFTVIGAGDAVLLKKPAPDIYEYVLQRLDVPADRCVAIEDSQNGLRAAKAAGLFTIVTPSYWTRTEDFSTADWVLPSLSLLERPSASRSASLVGHCMRGIQEIDRQLSSEGSPIMHGEIRA